MGLLNTRIFALLSKGGIRTTTRRRHARTGRRHKNSTAHLLSQRLDHIATQHAQQARPSQATLHPPEPPITLTALVACDPTTKMEILWHIARHVPQLRRWLVANPNATPELMEYVAQAGGPGVNEAIAILLASIENESAQRGQRS